MRVTKLTPTAKALPGGGRWASRLHHCTGVEKSCGGLLAEVCQTDRLTPALDQTRLGSTDTLSALTHALAVGMAESILADEDEDYAPYLESKPDNKRGWGLPSHPSVYNRVW